MINDTICEILVYSGNQEKLVSRVTATVDKYMARVPDFGDRAFWLQQRRESINRHLKPIRYNELIGCIEVHFIGSQLRADYWFTDASRIVMGSRTKGVIRWRGKLLEKNYHGSNLTSPEIFADFRAALIRDIKETPRLRKRHIDFNAFDRIGPKLDWRGFLGLP